MLFFHEIMCLDAVDAVDAYLQTPINTQGQTNMYKLIFSWERIRNRALHMNTVAAFVNTGCLRYVNNSLNFAIVMSL